MPGDMQVTIFVTSFCIALNCVWYRGVKQHLDSDNTEFTAGLSYYNMLLVSYTESLVGNFYLQIRSMSAH